MGSGFHCRLFAPRLSAIALKSTARSGGVIKHATTVCGVRRTVYTVFGTTAAVQTGLDQFSVRRERFHYFHFLWRSAEQYIIHLLLRRCSIIIFRIPRGRSTSLFLLFVNFHEGLLRHDSGSLFVHIRCARQTGRKGGHAEGRAR